MRVISIIVLAGIRRRRGGFFLHTIHTYWTPPGGCHEDTAAISRRVIEAIIESKISL